MDLVQLPIPKDGHVAEWLRNGLQNRVPRFNSGRGLQPSLAQRVKVARRSFMRRRATRVAASYGKAAQAKPRQTHRDFRRIAAFKAGPALLYALRARQLLFPGSSAVEQPAVNRLVAGSNPARGATYN